MKLLDFIPIRLTIFLILGILLGDWLQISAPFALITSWLLLALLGLLFLGKYRRWSVRFGLLTFALTSCIGVYLYSYANHSERGEHYTNHQYQGVRFWHLKISKKLKATDHYSRYYAEVIALDSLQRSGRMLLTKSLENGSKFQVDDELLVLAQAMEIRKPLNPHEFNYSNYLNKQGVLHQIRLDSLNHRLLKNSRATLRGMAASIRSTVMQKLESRGFGKSELSIIQALLLGDRMEISRDTYESYQRSGAVHLLAVSGLHIGIVLLILQFLLKPLGVLPGGNKLQLPIILLALWGFALLAGLSPSVIRAVSMFSFIAYAMSLNRPNNIHNTLALSVLFILLAFDPLLLFQPGFQMSYAAVIAIVSVYPRFMRFWLPRNVLVRKIWQLTSVSIAAQLGVLPISLYYFHQFPALFLVTNLIIVPFLGILLAFGILVVILALLDLLPNGLVWIYDSLIRGMNRIVDWAGRQRAFVFEDIPFDFAQLIICYLLIFSFLAVLDKFKFRRLALLMSVFILLQAWTVIRDYKVAGSERILVLHQYKNTAILHQKGSNLALYSRDPSRLDYFLSSYKTAERIKTITFKELKNAYTIGSEKLLVLDSLSRHPPSGIQVDYLLITQSPKIHLGHYLDQLKPKLLIADGSNYGTYIKRWQKTCAKRKLPFHYTGEKGAYIFEQSP
ncbi:ComEC/Rec2 family competence protein [Poritiphilus flavus]|uniref:DUF4131 domain-containing protein n=1 Tax=Poritiphilus flavus TaxID=2697053 RepID=A0A6L9EDM7_9FLAO|nr:ComEC/Rec2 family competence protein [Poritiphilus flavus]NAS12815.1 DUF4131 domain-containing protein [Poritiphilus flavus]